MKIRFIINPIAGTGKQKGIEDTIAKHLTNYDIVFYYVLVFENSFRQENSIPGVKLMESHLTP